MPNLTKTQKRRKLKARIVVMEEKAQILAWRVKLKNIPAHMVREYGNLITKITRLKSKLVELGEPKKSI